MTRRQVWRYKCDHCKKSNCSASSIKKHEVSCTANPNRVCRLCVAGGLAQQPISELIEILKGADETNKKDKLDKLREACDTCPACMLAAIRQSKLEVSIEDEEGIYSFSFSFNFKEELKAFWEPINDANLVR